MEAALLTPFLQPTILFSLIYKDYEKDLKNEIWLCHKYLKLSITEINNMPIQDRKFFIHSHNRQAELDRKSMKR
jgi:hypothetical protein